MFWWSHSDLSDFQYSQNIHCFNHFFQEFKRVAVSFQTIGLTPKIQISILNLLLRHIGDQLLIHILRNRFDKHVSASDSLLILEFFIVYQSQRRL